MAPVRVLQVTNPSYIVRADIFYPWWYVLEMPTTANRFVLSLFLFSTCALGQQPATDTIKAIQIQEKWRESQIPTWMSDFGQLGRYREANAKLAPTAATEDRVVFMGDSITDIWKLEKYFPAKPYLNRGIGGQTTPQMLVRFRPDVIDLEPRVVVILAGTNDIAGNTGPMSLAEIEANLKTMTELARIHRIRVVLSSVTPVNGYTERAKLFFPVRSPEQILELNRWMKDYCARNDCVYLDYFSAMVDDKGLLKSDLAEDGLHPNDKGYAIMAPLAQKAIDQALASKTPSSSANQ
jgi:lysophospholipase L1-like esterase